MTLISRYILRHFLRILGLCLATFTGIYLLVNLFEQVVDFINNHATAGDYLNYLINSIPPILVQVFPLAVLTSTVLTIGGFGRTNESTAMRACGISLWRIVRPLVASALVCTVLVFLLSEYICPASARQLNELMNYKMKGRGFLTLFNSEIWYRQDDKIINIVTANLVKKQIQGLTILKFNNQEQIIERLDAPRCTFQQNSWIAPKMTIRTFSPENADILSVDFLENQPVPLNKKPDELASRQDASTELTFSQLHQLVNKLEKEGYSATRQRVDMHNRLAMPFTCLIMGLLGVPFALQRGRGSNIALGIGLSVAVGAAYFIVQSIISSFGYAGALPPIIAAWAANIIFLLLAIWLQLNVRE